MAFIVVSQFALVSIFAYAFIDFVFGVVCAYSSRRMGRVRGYGVGRNGLVKPDGW